ncbi:MAG: oligopeptide ABC transporter substrate-binding protein OppA, partial [Lysobacterales bacterium]
MTKNYGVLAILASALIAGCGGGAQPGTAGGAQAQIGGASGTELAERQVLHVGNGAELQSLDPHRSEDTASASVHRDIYEGLVIESPKGDLIPGVASEWAISE